MCNLTRLDRNRSVLRKQTKYVNICWVWMKSDEVIELLRCPSAKRWFWTIWYFRNPITFSFLIQTYGMCWHILFAFSRRIHFSRIVPNWKILKIYSSKAPIIHKKSVPFLPQECPILPQSRVPLLPHRKLLQLQVNEGTDGKKGWFAEIPVLSPFCSTITLYSIVWNSFCTVQIIGPLHQIFGLLQNPCFAMFHSIPLISFPWADIVLRC